MPPRDRQAIFLALSAALAMLTLIVGLWMAWLSFTFHLLAAGGAMLGLTALCAWWWREGADTSGPA